MKILGIRSAPKKIRYALVDWDGTNAVLLNSNTESRLVFPAGMDEMQERLAWLGSEIKRIFHQNGDIDKVVTKSGEFGSSESKSTRATAYADAVILLACAKANLPVTSKVYASLQTRSADVAAFAEEKVGRTAKYWDKQMADAIAAAWSVRE